MCVLTIVPPSLAFYEIRFVTPFPESFGKIAELFAFVAVFVLGTTTVAANIGYLSVVALRRSAGSSL
ncbi:hypothetical protein OB920_20370 [Halobacteria archaeon HArc-gm2]|nr:hypothetical protein [Halobacteria archaeon HArc-gm2]